MNKEELLDRVSFLERQLQTINEEMVSMQGTLQQALDVLGSLQDIQNRITDTRWKVIDLQNQTADLMVNIHN